MCFDLRKGLTPLDIFHPICRAQLWHWPNTCFEVAGDSKGWGQIKKELELIN